MVANSRFHFPNTDQTLGMHGPIELLKKAFLSAFQFNQNNERGIAQGSVRPRRIVLATDFDGTVTLGPKGAVDARKAFTHEPMDSRAYFALANVARVGNELSILNVVINTGGAPDRAAFVANRSGLHCDLVCNYGRETASVGDDGKYVIAYHKHSELASKYFRNVLAPELHEAVRGRDWAISQEFSPSSRDKKKGFVLEPKGTILALHPRGFSSADDVVTEMVKIANQVIQAVSTSDLHRQFVDNNVLQEGFLAEIAALKVKDHGSTLEVQLPLLDARGKARDKGTVVRELVVAHNTSLLIVAGDGEGDLPAFLAANELRQNGSKVLTLAINNPDDPEVKGRAMHAGLKDHADWIVGWKGKPFSQDGISPQEAWINQIRDALEYVITESSRELGEEADELLETLFASAERTPGFVSAGGIPTQSDLLDVVRNPSSFDLSKLPGDGVDSGVHGALSV